MTKTEELRPDAISVPPSVTDGTGTPPASPNAANGGGSGLTRLTVNLNRQAVQALEQVSAATGYTKTDTVNRALQIYQIVQSILERNNGVLRIAHSNGEVERIYIV